jgi:hypothetical protein
MQTSYVFHRIATAPRQWRSVADRLAGGAPEALAADGGRLYGIWRSQIGRPRDELSAITSGPPGAEPSRHFADLVNDLEEVRTHQARTMTPTIRPTDDRPPSKQGNFAFRWFSTPAANWDEFLELCAAAWPGFEAAYDSQVLGLWRFADSAPGMIDSLMITRRPNLAMWERSKIPETEAEAEVRRKLSRRYDLCDDTEVFTATLLTATDREDTARWT